MPDLDRFDRNDFVLYGDRKQPLKVIESRDDLLRVEGPRGGEYILFYSDDGETLLEATPGNRQYASAVDDLRSVGRWEQQDDGVYEHSGTGDRIEIVKNDAGFWTIETTLDDVDLPGYGYTEREMAEEKAE
ncbi:MAG: hypothetical protein SVU32_00975, partial [Candidatus Nanohaloarchaea archaeon]|nr:hypothetical protein [Candidatus Nanohaloarchaea archaeon]